MVSATQLPGLEVHYIMEQEELSTCQANVNRTLAEVWVSTAGWLGLYPHSPLAGSFVEHNSAYKNNTAADYLSLPHWLAVRHQTRRVSPLCASKRLNEATPTHNAQNGTWRIVKYDTFVR